MSVLISRADSIVQPDYFMFSLVDSTSIDVERMLTPEKGEWLGVGRSRLVISTREQLLEVGLRLECWEASLEDEGVELPDNSEVVETASVALPSGRISIYDAREFVFDVFEVPPGEYAVRVAGWNRSRARQEFESLATRRRKAELSEQEFEIECELRKGLEHYMVQLFSVC
ncbi:hypothetical protein [Actinomadura nitritigenes]|uniref:hypothetical protein n=1 Tax=Actinomadura nitritigenes TaxID=134602 RepID=UPI003D8CC238